MQSGKGYFVLGLICFPHFQYSYYFSPFQTIHGQREREGRCLGYCLKEVILFNRSYRVPNHLFTYFSFHSCTLFPERPQAFVFPLNGEARCVSCRVASIFSTPATRRSLGRKCHVSNTFFFSSSLIFGLYVTGKREQH